MEKPPQLARLLSRDVSRIRIAVVGLGKMGAYHLQAIQRLASGESEKYYKAGLDIQIEKLELCGLCDPDPSKARSIAPNIPAFTDWANLLADCSPDLAVIASPTSTHFDLAMQTLESGVHTFVEKPLVTTLKEFNPLVKTAVAQGCRLMSGHIERYNPVAMKLRSMLASAEICAESYRFQRSQLHVARISDDIVTDKIIHDLDLAQYFFGTITWTPSVPRGRCRKPPCNSTMPMVWRERSLFPGYCRTFSPGAKSASPARTEAELSGIFLGKSCGSMGSRSPALYLHGSSPTTIKSRMNWPIL